MCVNIVSARLFIYRAAAELCKAAQGGCLYILGKQYLYLGVLKPVFGVRYAVYVLVKTDTNVIYSNYPCSDKAWSTCARVYLPVAQT